MDEQSAREHLSIGARVVWAEDGDIGEVKEIIQSGVYIEWESGARGWIAFADCQKIGLWRKNEMNENDARGLYNDRINSYGKIGTKRMPKPVTMVMCDCGHEVEKGLVMSASLGTSCPDCYDSMSD